MTQAKQYSDAVTRVAAERGLPRPAAAAIVARERPDLHRAWRESLKGGAPAPAPAPKAAAPKPRPNDMGAEFRQALEQMKMQQPAQPAPAPDSDEALRAKWEADESLRAEFADDFERFAAYSRAASAGRAKILRGGAVNG